ncbi:hypothetical protein QUF76_14590 [Desulfobacterales bacterium HSG16]|nr:hypothetical protein [Desulfobacterales bacterium HSG16]
MIKRLTENVKEFPQAVYLPEKTAAQRFLNNGYEKAVAGLLRAETWPAPERIAALSCIDAKVDNREMIDRAFAASEGVLLPENPLKTGFDPDVPRLSADEVYSVLSDSSENRKWIEKVLFRYSKRFSLNFCNDLPKACDMLFEYLCSHVSYWEADAFPIDAMMDFENRYDWTFTTDAWSLREQIRRESVVVGQAWKTILDMSLGSKILLILNERTPVDYMTCFLPAGASLISSGCVSSGISGIKDLEYNNLEYNDLKYQNADSVIVHTGLKISSSEHRVLLQDTSEGAALEKVMALAEKIKRKPVFLDFSRRRYPRSFLRVFRFAKHMGWGINLEGKVFDPDGDMVLQPKSSRGFQKLDGKPVITLFDPWPISDPKIIDGLWPEERQKFCTEPKTKPWQDDRIGARSEMEAGDDSIYREVSKAWILPVLGGWMRADDLFKNRLARFVRMNFAAGTSALNYSGPAMETV